MPTEGVLSNAAIERLAEAEKFLKKIVRFANNEIMNAYERQTLTSIIKQFKDKRYLSDNQMSWLYRMKQELPKRDRQRKKFGV